MAVGVRTRLPCASVTPLCEPTDPGTRSELAEALIFQPAFTSKPTCLLESISPFSFPMGGGILALTRLGQDCHSGRARPRKTQTHVWDCSNGESAETWRKKLRETLGGVIFRAAGQRAKGKGERA